jgi:DNA-binding CsgD family transcriptional regulator
VTDAAIRARAHWLVAEIAYGQSFPGAIHALEQATREPGADRAQIAQLELHLAFAWEASMSMGNALRHARRAERLAPADADPGFIAEILATRVYIEAVKDDRLDHEGLRRSLALEDPRRESPIQIRPSQFAASLDMLFGRLDRARSSLLELRTAIAESGEDHELPYLLNILAFVDILRGEHATAGLFIEEALRTAAVVGSETLRGHAIAVRAVDGAFRGDADRARDDASQAMAIFEKVGWGIGVWYALKALAFIALSIDEFDEVERLLGPTSAGLGSAVGFSPTPLFIGDLIDARLHTGNIDGASRLIAGFRSAGRSVDSPAARAIGARGRALLESARGQHAVALRSLAVAQEELAQLPIPSEHGRTLLAKGQILRRMRRKHVAREALVAARAVFDGADMPLWVAKTDAELARIGLHHGAGMDLTETERRVAELAALGLTNRAIAARAFLSPRSVEDVLARVYGKLGIRSRAELGARMARPR